jgi:hypothetical protein
MTIADNFEDDAEADAFRARLGGTFQGIMHWHQLDELWARIRSGRWFVYTTDVAPPTEPLSGEPLAARIDSLDAQLRREHAYGYCGIVYVDDVDAPTLVKIYDPRNLGTSCSHGAAPVPPRWILSTVPPASLVPPAQETGRGWRLWRPRSR